MGPLFIVFTAVFVHAKEKLTENSLNKLVNRESEGLRCTISLQYFWIRTQLSNPMLLPLKSKSKK